MQNHDSVGPYITVMNDGVLRALLIIQFFNWSRQDHCYCFRLSFRKMAGIYK